MSSSPPAPAVEVGGLRKSFTFKGQAIEAVRGIDLTVAAGEVFGLLGPNGAGKTTTLRILTTLLPADAGTALVAGADVRRSPGQVRRRIGYVGQLGGADATATGRENLMLAGRLYGLSAAATRARCAELLGVFGLESLAARAVRTYSGGQRRRLEVALGIMHRPRVLFLDEPTTGLDPQNRANLWSQLRLLRDGGTTVFLTTHYLDEADQLCDRVAIVDHGRVIALGRPDRLKERYSGDTITVTPDVPDAALGDVARLLAGAACVSGAVAGEDGTVRVTVARAGRAPGGTAGAAGSLADGAGAGNGDATAAMAAVFAVLAERGIGTRGAALARPSLDDVFLRETGRSLRDTGDPGGSGSGAESGSALGEHADAGVTA
ncbi:MAG TPA: ATP-binding cassette domain-containing protein [Trebonia sp.]|jgi:ABC-2 type transport system ATP-binding protein|nr:ATP-binding cassette domain-containing protein [Trebonia sp.]